MNKRILVKVKDIKDGQIFIKKGGEYAHIKVSESSVKCNRYGLDLKFVYGVSFTGNMSKLDPETLVHPGKYTDLIRNYKDLIKCEKTLGMNLSIC